ncbi:MAG TPA: S-methyl-5-thioribose-1-phosphate isomerase [Candidatus Limnocylindrales bacterium]|nr:S-methyl-5-thioribose-1-phosphate isomerase [Candidatus Limnocylindrales bacterium]
MTTDSDPNRTDSDPTRREFFRRFAGDLVSSAAQLSKAVADLRQQSAAEAAALLSDGLVPDAGPAATGTAALGAAGGPAAAAGAVGAGAGPSGFRTPFRLDDDDNLVLVDQRRLPDELVEVTVRGAPEGARAIRDMVVRGAPAIGQVAAIALALTGRAARLAQPHARRAILENAAGTLRNARPTAINLRWAVDRVYARYVAVGELNEDGEAIAAAMWREAMHIVAEASEDHGRIAEAGLALLPQPDGRPLEVLTHCNTGPLACGQYGTALGIVQAAHHAERPIHVWVDETRPYLQGARLTTWELRQAGVDHTLIPDGAAGSLMAAGKVDVVLVGADRIAANGDTANKLGTYPLAVLAQRHGIPFHVVAPTSSIDLETPDGSAIPIEERAGDEVATIRGTRIAPPGTLVHNPAFDVTPAELITTIVTERGVLRPPFGEALRAAVAARAARPSRPAA